MKDPGEGMKISKNPGGTGGYLELDPPSGWGISLDPGKGI